MSLHYSESHKSLSSGPNWCSKKRNDRVLWLFSTASVTCLNVLRIAENAESFLMKLFVLALLSECVWPHDPLWLLSARWGLAEVSRRGSESLYLPINHPLGLWGELAGQLVFGRRRHFRRSGSVCSQTVRVWIIQDPLWNVKWEWRWDKRCGNAKHNH